MTRLAWHERRVWLGLLCSGIFLLLAFRQTDWAALGAALRSVKAGSLALAVLLFGLNLVVRALRWQVLLAPVTATQTWEPFAFINIGYLANNLLPLKAGELIRSVLLADRKGVETSAVLATVFVERTLDVLSLAALAPILMLTITMPRLLGQGILVMGAAAAVLILALGWLAHGAGHLPLPGAHSLHAWPRTGAALPAPVQAITRKLLGLWLSFRRGLQGLRSPRAVTQVLFYSLLAWAFVVLATQHILQACHLTLPYGAALTVILMVNFGAAIPSSPGAIGVTHFLAALALGIWGVAAGPAAEFALIFHALPFLTTVLLGLAFVWRLGLPGRVKQPAPGLRDAAQN